MYVARFSLESFQHKCQHYPLIVLKRPIQHTLFWLLKTEYNFEEKKKPHSSTTKNTQIKYFALLLCSCQTFLLTCVCFTEVLPPQGSWPTRSQEAAHMVFVFWRGDVREQARAPAKNNHNDPPIIIFSLHHRRTHHSHNRRAFSSTHLGKEKANYFLTKTLPPGSSKNLGGLEL